MNKTGAIFIFFLAAMQFTWAQLPPGSIAPDFMVEDIDGQMHHLYDVLAENKIVIIEISATWCPPCWSYHQGHALQDFYAEHGPDGDDKAEVFWIEGDASTNLACIFGQQGCNGTSAGNFEAGTPYPILNNAVIAANYEITYFPTLYIICPNHRTYEVAPITADGLWEKAQVCPVAYGANNAGVFNHDPGYDLPEICGGVNLSPSFMLTNLGSDPLTSASIFLKWNGTDVQTIDWQGYLPTYGEVAIQFDSFPVNAEGTLNTVVTSINSNAGDEDFTNNYKNNIFSNAQHFNETRVVLKIRTDNYAKETYWELQDDLGNVLDHGGNQLVGSNGGGAFPLGVDIGPGTYSNNTLIKDTLELPEPGCFSIHFVDAYGDGMCCDFGNGYYKLYNIDNPVTPLILAGQFEAFDRHAFAAGDLSVNSTTLDQDLDVQLFPNPVADLLNIDLELAAPVLIQLQVLNALGQTVEILEPEYLLAGSATLQIPMQGLPNGLYFLWVAKEGGRTLPTVLKFVVSH